MNRFGEQYRMFTKIYKSLVITHRAAKTNGQILSGQTVISVANILYFSCLRGGKCVILTHNKYFIVYKIF